MTFHKFSYIFFKVDLKMNPKSDFVDISLIMTVFWPLMCTTKETNNNPVE